MKDLVPESVTLSDTDFDHMQKVLADPPPPGERLRALMRGKAPWEERDAPAPEAGQAE